LTHRLRGFDIHSHAVGKLNLHAIQTHFGNPENALQITQSARTGGTDFDQGRTILFNEAWVTIIDL